jgi:predicted O-methyltransferase YrrM
VIECFPDLVPTKVLNAAGFWTDKDYGGAICMHTDEAELLALYVQFEQPQRILEIGSYVGWSTAHLARHSKQAIDIVDPFIPDVGCDYHPGTMRRFWQNIIRAEVSDKVRLYPWRSPDCLPAIAHNHGWNLVVIDGNHQNKQPSRDVLGVIPYLAQDGVIVLHDTFMPHVRQAENYLLQLGFHCERPETPADMRFYWRKRPVHWKKVIEQWRAAL